MESGATTGPEQPVRGHRGARRCAGLVACTAAGLVLLLAVPARAEDVAIPALSYDAPAACPSRDDFSALVAARTPAWLRTEEPFAVSVEVHNPAQGMPFAGKVTLVREGRATVRELSAPHCDELVRALSLIVAILIDPRAGHEATTGELPPPPVPAGAARAPSSTDTPKVAAPPHPPAEPPWFVVGAEAMLGTAVAAEPVIGPRIFLGIGRGDASGWLSSARLAFSRSFSHAASPTSGARAEFELGTARLDGCVVRAAVGIFAVEPCVFFEAGRLEARGLHRSGDVQRMEPWATTGLLLRPTLTLARRVVVSAGLGFHVPLTHYEFAFTGEPLLTKTGNLGFDAALGVGVRFP